MLMQQPKLLSPQCQYFFTLGGGGKLIAMPEQGPRQPSIGMQPKEVINRILLLKLLKGLDCLLLQNC